MSYRRIRRFVRGLEILCTHIGGRKRAVRERNTMRSRNARVLYRRYAAYVHFLASVFEILSLGIQRKPAELVILGESESGEHRRFIDFDIYIIVRDRGARGQESL